MKLIHQGSEFSHLSLDGLWQILKDAMFPLNLVFGLGNFTKPSPPCLAGAFQLPEEVNGILGNSLFAPALSSGSKFTSYFFIELSNGPTILDGFANEKLTFRPFRNGEQTQQVGEREKAFLWVLVRLKSLDVLAKGFNFILGEGVGQLPGFPGRVFV